MKSPTRKVLEAVLLRLRADERLQAIFGDRIRAFRAAQLVREGSIETPMIAVVSSRVEEKLVATGRVASFEAHVLLGICTTFDENVEPDDFVLAGLDNMDFVKRSLAAGGGALELEGECVTDSVLRFTASAEPVVVPGTSILIHDLVCVFSTRVQMDTGGIRN